jgi:hypothetical protein
VWWARESAEMAALDAHFDRLAQESDWTDAVCRGRLPY